MIKNAAMFSWGAGACEVIGLNGAVFIAGLFAVLWWCWDEYRMWRERRRVC